MCAECDVVSETEVVGGQCYPCMTLVRLYEISTKKCEKCDFYLADC